MAKNWILYLSTFAANLIFISYGTLLGWNNPVLTKFRSNNTEINPLEAPLSVLEVSIATSILPVGSILAAPLVTKLPDIFGRRKTLVYLATIGLISFGVMMLVDNFWAYCLTYMGVCISVAAGTVVAPTYISEISETRNRGIFGTAVSISKALGQFYVFVVGPHCSFRIFVFCCGLILILYIAIAFFTQESPIFLTLKGDADAALKSLSKLRKNKTFAECQKEMQEKEEMVQNKGKQGSFKMLFTTKAARKAFFISLVIRCLPFVCGIYIVVSFLGDLLRHTKTHLSPENLALVIIGTKILSATACSSLVEKFGRKPLLLVGTLFCSFSMLGLGIYLYCLANNYEMSEKLSILPFIFIFTFVIAYTLGLGGIPYIVVSELLPNEVRATGTGIVNFVGNLLLFGVSFNYPLISHHFGNHYCMLGFSFFSFFGFVFILFFLPETKGKSFAEIKRILEM